jgi:FMN phosphatase YigB (HAD superfamily)
MRVAIVHYHLDPGGVTSVIRATSELLTNAGARHVILTGEPANNYPHLRHIPGLGYLSHPGGHTAEELTASLVASATDALGGAPDVWHFHNHSLGKNVFYPEIVARLAATGAGMLLQIHDLAEQGRPGNFPLIAGHPWLYPFSPRVRYAFLNPRDLAVFTAAGLPPENAALLPNPIFPGAIQATSNESAPLLFAPVRGIRRKNIGELVLLATLAPRGTRVAISRAPLDPEALAIHDTWRKFTERHRLPIGFDVVDRFTPAPGADPGFESWIAHASHFVTTSVSEGFGLPFLESVARGKPLLGRDLPHLTADHARHGITWKNLYQRILIPVEWVDLTILESHLTTTLERNHRLYGRHLDPRTIELTTSSLYRNGWLDFGNLPEPLQQGAIERLAESIHRATPLVEIGGMTFPLETWLAEILTDRMPAATPNRLAPWSPEIYQKSLTAAYQVIATSPAAPLREVPAEKILDAHLVPAAFHFLLSAPEPRPAAPRFLAAVFDIYGTLLLAPAGGVKPDPLADPVLRDILRSHGHEPPASPSSELHAAVLRHHLAAATSHPEVDLRLLWREILNLSPDTDPTELVIELEQAWHPAKPMPGADQVVRRIARSGMPLGLLSNAQVNTLEDLGDTAHFFDPGLTLLSYQHGVAKPSPEFFALLADRLAARDIAPGETLFIGNDPLQDILPAARAGFRTALFIGHPDALRPGDCRPDFILRTWSQLPALLRGKE